MLSMFKVALLLPLILTANICFAAEASQTEGLAVEEDCKGILSFDPKSKNYLFKVPSIININGRQSYLAVEPASKNSYQTAFFIDRAHLENRGRSYTISDFAIEKGPDETFRIRCDLGEKSYLALSPVSKDSYQYAIFATEEYLANNKSLMSHFWLKRDLTRKKSFTIEVANQPGIFLAVGEMGWWQYDYAIFAGVSYLKANAKNNYSILFKQNPVRWGIDGRQPQK